MALQYVKGNSVFIKTNSNKKQYQYLTKDIETDVVIIGGGVTGSICGYYLSKININVINRHVLEEEA